MDSGQVQVTSSEVIYDIDTAQLPEDESTPQPAQVIVYESSIVFESQGFMNPTELIATPPTIQQLRVFDRSNFIFKVCMLLIVQLSVLIVGLALMEAVQNARDQVYEQPWLALGCFGMAVFVLSLVYYKKAKYPANLLALFSFVTFTSGSFFDNRHYVH